MEPYPNRTSALHVTALTLGAALALGLSLSYKSATGLAAGCFLVFGIFVVILAWLQGWLRAKEEQEQQDFDNLRREKQSGAAKPAALL